MLSIGCVTIRNRQYLTDQVAHGAEEYYSGKGEAGGTWVGGALGELGLSGKVESSEFNLVLDGVRPGESEPLAPNFANRKVLGIDLTFNAPKSVSTMFALGSISTRKAVQAAHDAAVLEGLAYMESQCAWGREGKAGKNKVEGSGFIASAWRHRTSRAGDPHLHTHVVVNNLVHTQNDRWVSLDTARLWQHLPTGSRIYQMALRRNLTEALGVEWGERSHGLADIAGFPSDLKDLFSKRSKMIREQAHATCMDNPQGRQIAALVTREPKGKANRDSIYEDWSAEAGRIGCDESTIAALCGRATVEDLSQVQHDQILSRVASEGLLTKTQAHFDRRHVINVIADHYAPATATPASIEAIADRYLETAAVSLSEHATSPSHAAAKSFKAGERIFSTPQMLAIEKAAAESVVGRVSAGIGEVPHDVLGTRHRLLRGEAQRRPAGDGSPHLHVRPRSRRGDR